MSERKKTHEDYQTVYIKRYNNGERNFKREHTLVDTTQLVELLGEREANKIAKEILDTANIKYDPNELDCVDITYIHINIKTLEHSLKKLRDV